MARPANVPPDVEEALKSTTGYSRIPNRHYDRVFTSDAQAGPQVSYEHLARRSQRELLRDAAPIQRGIDPFKGFGNAVPSDKQVEALSEYWQDSYVSYQEQLANRGWEYSNYGSDEGWEGPKNAARIEDFPTSTTNPRRPRTVAAGWSSRSRKDQGRLTVVFRDGTYYNYYDVSYREWQDFRYEISKGRYIKQFLDSKPRGPADMSNMDARVRAAIEILYVTARTAQKWRYRPGTKGKYRNRTRKPNWKNPPAAKHNTSATRKTSPSGYKPPDNAGSRAAARLGLGTRRGAVP